MPIYEYRCTACNQVSEFIVIGKEETPACRACGSTSLEKLMSAHNTTASSRGPAGGDMPSGGGCCGNPGGCGAPGSCCSA